MKRAEVTEYKKEESEMAKEEGLKAAFAARVKAKAYVGIRSKQLGVLFLRLTDETL